jgi:thiol-disulfide isomerase/thioredoxin
MRRFRISPTPAAIAAWLLASAAGAQTSDPLLRGFEPSGEWLLVVDGREQPRARIYDSTRAQALLVLSAELPSPVLVDRRGRAVATLDLLKVAERADGTIDLLADALLEPVGALQIRNRTEAHFSVAGKSIALRPTPWSLGDQRGAALLESDAGYRWRAARYRPDAETLERLRGRTREIRVLTFYGSWCPHCRDHLPYLLRVEQELAGSRLRFDYRGVPSQIGSDPEAARWGVGSVPTAIVLVDGREVGRLPANGWTNPERALEALLEAAGS